MKQLLLTITLLLTALLPTQAAKRPDANPINIAAKLVEKTDSAKVASTLEYYGYSHQGSVDGYTVMKDSKGNEIRFSFNEKAIPYPSISVKARGTHRDIDSRLKELNFEKVGNNYQRVKNKYSRYKTECHIGHNTTLTFRRVQN